MNQTDTLPLKWYAIHVRSRHEFQIFDRLKLKGIEAFLPTVEKLRKWKDRKKLVTFPLFPGYLFVRITNEARNMLEVLKIKGVVNMICAIPGEPAPIPEDVDVHFLFSPAPGHIVVIRSLHAGKGGKLRPRMRRLRR